MIFLRILLLPFSFLYLITITVINYLYDRGFIKSYKFNTPVISIGNISTGGTGKTPLVKYLADYFLNKNKSVGIISRGYKRKSNSLVIAYDGNNITSDLHSAGDELFMLINRFSGNNKFYAIAFKDRIKAIEVMINNFSPDIIILDDAFQNRRISKSVDIVMIDNENTSCLNKLFLPAGNLREPKSSLKRADLILNNFKFSVCNSKVDNSIFYKPVGIIDFTGKSIELKKDVSAVLISGIANNKSFHHTTETLNIRTREFYSFPDHYDYTISDVNKFISEYDKDTIFLTTEKDFIKLKEFKDFVSNYPVYYLRIDVILDNGILDNLFTNKDIL